MNDKNETKEELLDRIVLGRFDDEEISAMIPAEEQEDFLNELALHRSAAAIIQRHSIIEQVRTVQDSFLEKYRETKKEGDEAYKWNGRYIVRSFIGIAAAFIITCSIIVLYWFNGNTGEKLFSERYKPYRVNVERSDANSNSPIVRQYLQENFNQVIVAHENTPATTARDKMVAASAYLHESRYDEAIKLLSDIISQNLATGNRLYNDEAEYYLALSYLKKKETGKAVQLFEKIYADKEHTFNSEIDWWFITRVKWLK